MDWKTTRTIGEGEKLDCLLIYEVQYEKYLAKETLRLVKEGSGMRIIAYNIHSEGFLT